MEDGSKYYIARCKTGSGIVHQAIIIYWVTVCVLTYNRICKTENGIVGTDIYIYTEYRGYGYDFSQKYTDNKARYDF